MRRAEYKRVTGDERIFIKGQRYVLFSRRENLSDGGSVIAQFDGKKYSEIWNGESNE